MLRRDFFLRSAMTALSAGVLVSGNFANAQVETANADIYVPLDTLREQWMNSVTACRDLNGNLVFTRFVEPIYVLLKPISWAPNVGMHHRHSAVEVPIGFVTDLTSVPRPFWSMLPRDGNYTYAAVIHDYLYWEQTTSREDADDILRLAMQDLEIKNHIIAAIHSAVRLAGGAAWSNNQHQKNAGEKRVLKAFPSEPTTRWEEWKLRPDVFA